MHNKFRAATARAAVSIADVGAMDDGFERGSCVSDRGPKDERREKILACTWRLIARDGIGATNMRALAAEAGYANGALAYYFSGKDDLLLAAYDYVLRQTNLRIAATTRGLKGLAALRAFCAEIVPDDELKILEARVVLPFWSTALHHAGFADLHERGMIAWRRQMRKHVTEAASMGEIPPGHRGRRHAEAVEALLSMLSGMQSLAVLSPKQHTPRMMWAMIDQLLLELATATSVERSPTLKPRSLG